MADDRDILFGTAGLSRFAAPREQRVEARPESNMLKMGLVAGGIAVLVLAVLTVWSWAGHRHGGVPVVDADARPVKEKPLDQGGLKVEGANEAILSGSTDSKPNVNAAPEAPALSALRAANPPTAPSTAPLANITAPPPSAGTTEGGVRVSTLGETPLQPQLNASRPAPAAAQTPQPQMATAATPAPEMAKPMVPAAAQHHAAVVKPGSAMVQLAALPSQKAANAEWERLSKHFSAQLGGHVPSITSVNHDGKTLWRLRVGGFEDKTAAGALCQHLKSAGGQCMVVHS